MSDDDKKKNHSLPIYIKDKTLFKAVNFARLLHRKGMNMGLAIYRSSKYYKISQKKVSEAMGKIGAIYSNKERNWKTYKKSKQIHESELN